MNRIFMTKLLPIILFCISFPFLSHSQDIRVYFDTSKYYQVDSVFFTVHGVNQALYILYGNDDDESVIIYKNNGRNSIYKSFLPCYTCRGRGMNEPTYMGHTIKGESIVLAHEYFLGRDSVYLGFTGGCPAVQKIIRRSYSNEKVKSVDDAGNYLFTAKKNANTSIDKFQLPVDNEDPKIRALFDIRKIKWVKI